MENKKKLQGTNILINNYLLQKFVEKRRIQRMQAMTIKQPSLMQAQEERKRGIQNTNKGNRNRKSSEDTHTKQANKTASQQHMDQGAIKNFFRPSAALNNA